MTDWMLDPPEDEDFEDREYWEGFPYDDSDWYDDEEAAANAASDWENERDRY